ncbi:heme o synthase [Alicyclobacillus sp. SO9]|uniref:heme o synthase n=1 Tax=Alicyclobacillus sp. SO9 TaxID=2665646 RepID=UPI0018E74953|nr:heme o synthase [Alicyclobacillus sp. SO9]QQE80191.1 protoheme IX farnesyltransferase [Alicyclobacillus sp. SO9]
MPTNVAAVGQQKNANPAAVVKAYVSITKTGITFANVMSTFAGFWVASQGHPEWGVLLWTLLGTGLVVAGGAALNNFIDRDIDGSMKRTEARALVAGRVRPRPAFLLGITLGIVGLIILITMTNVTAAICAFIGLVFYAYVYTVWLKRTTTLSTVLGGIPGAIPPLIGWTAANGGRLDLAGLTIFFIFFLWQIPHFLPFAMKRTEEYRKAGIPLLPVVVGFSQTKSQVLKYTIAMFFVSLLPYALRVEGLLYLVLAGSLGLGFLYHAIKGQFSKTVETDLIWANKVFRYSLIYLTTMCLVLVIGVM